eukprot:3264161-Amphidinium_carterae.1
MQRNVELGFAILKGSLCTEGSKVKMLQEVLGCFRNAPRGQCHLPDGALSYDTRLQQALAVGLQLIHDGCVLQDPAMTII